MTRLVLAAGVGLYLGVTLMSGSPGTPPPTFGDDLAFLTKHTQLVVLSDESGKAQVAVAPRYQGRVLTSTAAGGSGTSYGWINRELIASGERRPHMNAFGGEDRFWLGPEGGQFAIFFKPGTAFTLDNWQTPDAIDWDEWPVVRQSTSEVAFCRAISLTNYSGTRFDLTVERTVRLIPQDRLATLLRVALGEGVSAVAYESENRITNASSRAWTKASGLLSIWILGMFQPSDQTTVVIPIRPGPESQLGPKVNDAYFGKVPADRLKIGDHHLFFRGDGLMRGKIGVGPRRAKPVLGSYDGKTGVLTLVQFSIPPGAAEYVNSMWEIQKAPFAGDVVNSYNDGPPSPGAKPLGPFYELESSSPAAALAPGQSLTHIHRTIHLQGPAERLSAVAESALGVSVATIQAALGATK